jgi:hypothetical protein
MERVKILVAHHKTESIIGNVVYLPIHVGKSLSSKDLDMQCDNEGENISDKNPLYCEMTGWYWAWKHLKAEYIGLCHYRRYFTFRSIGFKERLIAKLSIAYVNIFGGLLHKTGGYFPNIVVNNENELRLEAKDFAKCIDDILKDKDYDAVVPSPHRFTNGDTYSYFVVFGREFLSLLSEIIERQHPDFYPFYKASLKESSFYAGNMAIFKYKHFDEYCTLVFSILKEFEVLMVERGLCIDPYKERLCSRIIGYLAEVLTNAFIFKMRCEKYKILRVNTLFLSSN